MLDVGTGQRSQGVVFCSGLIGEEKVMAGTHASWSRNVRGLVVCMEGDYVSS